MRYLVLLALASVTGCIGDDEDAKGSATCDPAAFAFLVGQPKSALDGVLTPETVRVMNVTSPATMDHRPDRLNVIHDDDDTIIKVTCG